MLYAPVSEIFLIRHRHFWSTKHTHTMKSSDNFKKHISSQSAEKLARKPLGPFSERYYSMQEKRNNLAKTRPTSANHFDRTRWSEKNKNLAMKLQSVFRQTSLTRKWTLGSTTSHCLGKIIWLDKKAENMMTLRAFPRTSLTWKYMNLAKFFFLDGFQTYPYCKWEVLGACSVATLDHIYIYIHIIWFIWSSISGLHEWSDVGDMTYDTGFRFEESV